MYRGILILLLSAVFMFHCSKVERYLSGQEQDITVKKSEKPLMNITGAAFDSGKLIIFYNCLSDSGATEKNFLYQKSTNNGISWSKPEKVFKNEIEINNPFVTKLFDESLMLVFNDISDSLQPYSSFYLVRSYDYGKTFTVPRMITLPEYKEVKITSGVVQMGRSMLFLPIQAENNEGKKLSLLLFSQDKGRTWNKVLKMTPDTYQEKFLNPVLINLQEEILYGLLEGENGYVYSTLSRDTGKTWTKPQCTNIYGKDVSLLLSDKGNLICCYEDHTPEGISMMKSFDLGMTWESEIQCISGNNMVINPYLLSINKSNTAVFYSHRTLIPEKNQTKWQVHCKFIRIKSIEQPKALAVSSQRNGIRLRWNKVDNASYYIVYRSGSPDSLSGSEYRIAQIKGNNYIDKSVKNAEKYYYSVSAVEGYGKLISGTGNESDLSDPVFVEYNSSK